MKTLFIIMAHGQENALFDLADALVRGAANGHVVIHFDANASSEAFANLRKLVDRSEKIHLVEDRVRCLWGSFALVEASLASIRRARELGVDFDYTILLSGDCYPIRPIAALEAFLTDNAGHEFIEAYDESWMLDGLRSERYQLYFPFKPNRNASLAERYATKLQRLLGVRRKVPNSLTIRFGSQWWALTWETCQRVLDYIDCHRSVRRFFQSVFIPDEMVFPTLVHHLAGERITGYGLTHYLFTDRGRPVVYYDDHGDLPFETGRFFVRKVSVEAKKLRQKSLEVAVEPLKKDGAPIRTAATRRLYEAKLSLQVPSGCASAIFDQSLVQQDSHRLLSDIDCPILVVYGYEIEVDSVLQQARTQFECLGYLFSPGSVDFGAGRTHWRGLRASDNLIRDVDPIQYLARVAMRCGPEPLIFGWTAGDDDETFARITKSAQVRTISVLPVNRRERARLARERDRDGLIEQLSNALSRDVIEKGLLRTMPDPEPWGSKVQVDTDGLSGRQRDVLLSVYAVAEQVRAEVAVGA